MSTSRYPTADMRREAVNCLERLRERYAEELELINARYADALQVYGDLNSRRGALERLLKDLQPGLSALHLWAEEEKRGGP